MELSEHHRIQTMFLWKKPHHAWVIANFVLMAAAVAGKKEEVEEEVVVVVSETVVHISVGEVEEVGEENGEQTCITDSPIKEEANEGSSGGDERSKEVSDVQLSDVERVRSKALTCSYQPR